MVANSTWNGANFKKISFKKLHKFGLVPTSNFAMKICSNFIHIIDSYSSWVVLSIDVCRLLVCCLVIEKWPCESWSTARNFYRERRRRRQHLIPLVCVRMLHLHMRSTPNTEGTYGWDTLATKMVGHRPAYMKSLGRQSCRAVLMTRASML